MAISNAIAFALIVAVATAVGSGDRLLGARHGVVRLGHIAAACRPGRVPDRRRTPGTTINVGAAQVCVAGYSERVREVPESEKRQVYAEYGIRSHKRGQYEVDHLIALELGGSNGIRRPSTRPGSRRIRRPRPHQGPCRSSQALEAIGRLRFWALARDKVRSRTRRKRTET